MANMTMADWQTLSERINRVAPSATLAVDSKAKAMKAEGIDVIGFGAGEPNFPTPAAIVAAAAEAVQDPKNYRYTPTAGLPELRKAIADKTLRDSGYGVDPNQVIVTNGGKQAVYESFQILLNDGDEVIIPTPYWTSYPEAVKLAGGVPVEVFAGADRNFEPSLEDLEAARTERTKAIIVNTPNNPMGSILDQGDMEAIAALADRHRIAILSDEVYESLIYDGKKHFSLFQIPGAKDNHFVVNSLSKTYAMTGWRIGYVVGNHEAIDRMAEFREGVGFCVPPFIQEAAIAAITGPQDDVQYFLEQYDRRRHIIVDGLNQIPGFKCLGTEGAFYAFPNIKAFGKSSYDFAMEILTETHVALTPGSAFGKMGEGYLRIPFAESEEVLQEAVDRIKAYVIKAYPHL